MNKLSKILTAISLSFVIIASASSALAMKHFKPPRSRGQTETSLTALPPTPPHNVETIRYINEQVKAFEDIAPGVFTVAPYFRKDPYFSPTMLNQMVTIFKRFPNITRKFIEQTQLTDRKKFEFEVMNPQAPPLISFFNTYGTLPASAFNVKTDSISIGFNMDPRYLRQSFSLRPNGTMWINYNTLRYAISHEMGHLLNSVVLYSKDRDLFLHMLDPFRDSPGAIFTQIFAPFSPDGQRISRYIQSILDERTRIAQEIKDDIITIAIHEYGYRGNGFITPYGETDPSEWVADAVACAFNNKRLNALNRATIDFFDAIDEKFSE